MNAFIVCLLLLFAQVCADRWALVVTIAGTRKLSDYFEWGCRTIENSKDIADMLVFHEGNERLKHVTCASNVKFISLGENGFAKHIISEFMGISNLTSQENREHLTTMLSDIIVHMPKYLLEIKPAIGMLFRDYLIPYSHWSSTDPDIIWGNLTNWIDIADTQTFDIVSVSKVLDAGRLFLRSQFTLHKNTPEVTNLWKSLLYFAPEMLAQRIASAGQGLKDGQSSSDVFSQHFFSSEGWYSDAVFKSQMNVKIIGRSFDDYHSDPVVLIGGMMMRCQREQMQECIARATNHTVAHPSIHLMPPIQETRVEAHLSSDSCFMGWLPDQVRQCIATQEYDKEKALSQDASHETRLTRLGEVYSYTPIESKEQLSVGPPPRVWFANSEKLARRQVPDHAAFFHFRAWNEGSRSVHAMWSKTDESELGCMVLYIAEDEVLIFEPCSVLLRKDATYSVDPARQALHQAKLETFMGSLSQKLVYARRRDEIGPTRPRTKHHGHRGHKFKRRKNNLRSN